MIGINGVDATTGAAEAPAARKRDQAGAVEKAPKTDEVSISPEAVQVADATRAVQESREVTENEMRLQRIEEAKKNIEQGAHRVQDVVLAVASRIAGAMPQGY